jgi:hypothetical protein
VKRGQIVEIRWHDASSHTVGWDAESEYRKWAHNADGGWNCRTVGYLLHKGKRSITVVTTYGKRPDGGMSVDHAMSIPLGMIASCKVLNSN